MNTVVIKKHNDEHYTWLLLDANAKVMEEHRFAALNDCPPSQKGQSLIFLLPGALVNVFQINMPKMSRSELIKAVPYALEEQLAQDINQLHFSISSRDTDGQVVVAVMDKQEWQQLLAELAAAKLQATRIMPDYLALPDEHDAWTIVFDDTLAQVRMSQYAGFVADMANVHLLLKLHLQQYAAEQQTLPKRLHVLQINKHQAMDALNDLDPEIDVSTVKVAQTLDLPGLLQHPPLNLLPHARRTKVQKSADQKSWWRCGYALIALIVVLFVGHFTQYFYFKYENDKVTKQVDALYKTIFPQATDVVEPRFRVTRLLTQYTKAASSNAFLSLMSQIAIAIQQHPLVKMLSLSYQDQQLMIAVNAKAMIDLEQFTQTLTKQGLVVKQKQLVMSKASVTAQLVIGGAP